jgi:RNA polymerase sigma-70 factor (ECF subfamily)
MITDKFQADARMQDGGERDSGDAPHVPAMRELAGLWVQSQSVISAYISANVVDAHHVEDLVQEVAQICAEKFDSFDRQRSFVSWALGIARNRLLKYYRTRSRDRLVLSETALVRLEAGMERIQHEAEDRREALRICLRQIHGRRQAVLTMRYGNNARVADIASQLGMSASAVSVMLHRVREALFACVRRHLASKGG